MFYCRSFNRHTSLCLNKIISNERGKLTLNIICTQGDILKSHTEALVNPVNCEGVMGKGLALQFKRAYPQTNIDYIKACKDGRLRIGTVHYYAENNKIIINFPTKDKWRNESKLEYINSGMNSLVDTIDKLDINSISLSALGCGLGGLDWNEVKPLILSKLSKLDKDIEVVIYEPM